MSLLTDTLQTLLRIQQETAAIKIRLARELGASVGFGDELERIAMQGAELEQRYAQAVARALGAQPMALGGLVTQPTFALLGEAGPEMVVPMKKKRRKISKYQREFGRNLKKIKKDATLKNGSLRKGVTQKKLFAKAHKMTRKMMK